MKSYIAIGLLVLMTGLSAQGRGGFGPGFGWNDDLNLTTEQIKQIDGFRTDFRKNQIDVRADMQKLRLELKELMQVDDPNQKAIDSQLKKIQDKELALEKLRVAHQLEVRAILTDDQKVLFDQHSFGKGMGRHHKGNRGGDRDGRGPGSGGNKHGGRNW
ncbi:MAG: Spy/CpxP family protein refolding chaperone [Candidatus Marinimicrobia bacterium]|nr:Spy/CpxP family protein refolding chaperone [Candidatus Neomarinimicrobiota bacterium]